jgi:hypothetical protein
MEKTNHLNTELKSYIKLAQNGLYPLFYKEWIQPEGLKVENLTYPMAQKKIKEIFKKLSKHTTMEKKKILLSSLSPEERNAFVSSFIKVVEHNVLKEVKTLH